MMNYFALALEPRRRFDPNYFGVRTCHSRISNGTWAASQPIPQPLFVSAFWGREGGIVYVSLNQTRARCDFTALRATQDAA